MLHFVYGGDSDSRREKVNKILTSYKNLNTRDLKTEEITQDFLKELSNVQGLFDGVQIFLLRGILESKELKEILKKGASVLSESSNIFIVNESTATKDIWEGVEKKGGKVVNCGVKEKANKKDGGNFALGDALGRRDRKASWVLYQEALSKGAVPEELHGILFWQMKNIFLAKLGGATGLTPYPLMKAKSFSSKWQDKEIKRALTGLVDIYHQSHRGIVEFPIALEMFLLETV